MRGSAANRVTPHLLEVPPAELAEWCMVRGHRKTKPFGRRREALPHHHSPPAAAHSVTYALTAPFRAILLCKIARNPQDYPTLAITAEPPSLTHNQIQSVKNTIKKGRHNVTTLYIKYRQTPTLFNS